MNPDRPTLWDTEHLFYNNYVGPPIMLYFKKPTKTAKQSIKIAKRGYPQAQYELGKYYYYGNEGLSKNYKNAIYWFEKAALQGDLRAKHDIGICYYYGHGVEKDYQKAVYCFSKVAEQGDPLSEYDLGLCYYYGYGVEKDYERFIYWLNKSAEHECWRAIYDLAICFANGDGVRRDYNQALKWMKQAAERGSGEATYTLGIYYENGYGVEKDYVQAANWMRRAAELGDAKAAYTLGLYYENGYGVEKDKKQTDYWMEKAAIRGHKLAQKKVDNHKQITTYTYTSISTVENEVQKKCEACVYLVKSTSTYLGSASCFKKQTGVSSNMACKYYKSLSDMHCEDCGYFTFTGGFPPGTPPWLCGARFMCMAFHHDKACERFKPKY